ncbi:MAG: trigger factor [Kiritimatiellae bacterium]|nr:trigger factor [Kiritimatiellia bacterium]
MKVQSQNAGTCRMKLTVNVDAEETRPDYKEVVKVFLNNATVKGFRKGKAPRDIILKNFESQIKEETVKRLLNTFSKKAIEDQKLKASAIVDITDVVFTGKDGLSCNIIVDVQPEFELPAYKDIKVEQNDVTVTDEQLNARMDEIRRTFAKFEDADADYLIADGDLVSMDFTGTADGKPIDEIEPNAKPIATGTDFWIQIPDHRFIPEVVEALKGLRTGETTEVKFKFAGDYMVKALQGKDAVYNVTVKKVRKCQLPTNEELVAQIEAESYEKICENVRASLQESANQAETNRQNAEIIEKLMNLVGDFDLPQSEIDSEINETLEQMYAEAQYRGLTRENLEQNRDALIKNAEKVSRDRLRVRYLLGAIAKAEGIKPTAEDITDEINVLAEANNKTPAQVRAAIEKNGRVGMLYAQIIQNKTLAMLRAN